MRVFNDNPEARPLAITEGPARAWAVVWPEVGAYLRSMHRITLEPGGRTIAMSHPMEAVYYLMAGSAVVEDLDQGISEHLVQGSMFLVDPGTNYRVVSEGRRAEIVGGPCPPDPSLYS